MVHLLGEDRKALRGIARLLAGADYTIACHRTAGELRHASARRPGCVVLLAGGRDRKAGAAALGHVAALADDLPHLPLILVTTRDTACLAAEAMRLGAFYVIARRRAAEALAARVAEALCPGPGNGLAPAARDGLAACARLADLTGRERSVFREIVAGHTNKAAARRLGISARTVETHRAAIMRKTGATNLADLIALARDAGEA